MKTGIRLLLTEHFIIACMAHHLPSRRAAQKGSKGKGGPLNGVYVQTGHFVTRGKQTRCSNIITRAG